MDLPTEPSVIELLRRAQAGDDRARDQLFSRVYDRVLGIVRGRLGPGLRRFHESGDVVQEALLQAVRSLGQVQVADEAALLAWLASVVENRLRDLAKFHGAQKRESERERRETSIDPDGVGLFEARAGAAPGAGPASLAAEQEQHERLKQALTKLEPKRAQAIELRGQGLAWSLVAERLGLPSEGAARMLHARALVDLGRALEGPAEDPLP